MDGAPVRRHAGRISVLSAELSPRDASMLAGIEAIQKLREILKTQTPAKRWDRRSEYQRAVALYRAGLDPSKKNQHWHLFDSGEQDALLAVGDAWI